jgi:hypothetical protein
LTPYKTAKLLFLNKKMVKCRSFHSAAAAFDFIRAVDAEVRMTTSQRQRTWAYSNG